MKELIIAKSAGFCFGVQRSIDMAEQVLKEGRKLKSLGELVHNSDVINDLCAHGMTVIESANLVDEKDNVIIRAHGISQSVYDELSSSGAQIIDATCPKVMAIHKIVQNAADKGRIVIIIGTRNHPEVEGISGRCDNNYIVENITELEKLICDNPFLTDIPITVVSQTTQMRSNYEQCCDYLKKECTNIELFDTICSATFTRQSEAMELSRRCDYMVIIGGKNSANSLHLAEICKNNCSKTQFIERANELDLSDIADADVVGITAGASTPAWIIKEVVNKMSDEIKVEQTFDDMLEDSLKPIYNGERVSGTVAAISGTEVTVDLGAKYSGFIPTSEFTDAGIKVADAVKIGDPIEAIVVRVNDVEGTAMLSKKRLDSQRFWDDIENASNDGEIIDGVVVDTNKGGLVVNVKGVRVFVPASQSGLPREADLSELLKQDVKLKITEFNKGRKRVVGSIRRAVNAERKAASEAIWNDIEVGKKYVGKVKSLTNYGAFVDIGGIDGMIHQSELSWGRIKHPSDVVNPGDEVEVRVLGFDKDNHRISLGLKDPDADPWKAFVDKYNVDDVVDVKIVKLMPFGAFAEVMENVDGLIHISQLSNHRISKAEDAVKVGDVVSAKITNIDEDKHKISLSIRALLPVDAKDEYFSEEEAEEAEMSEDIPVEEISEIITEAATADVENDLESEETDVAPVETIE